MAAPTLALEDFFPGAWSSSTGLSTLSAHDSQRGASVGLTMGKTAFNYSHAFPFKTRGCYSKVQRPRLGCRDVSLPKSKNNRSAVCRPMGARADPRVSTAGTRRDWMRRGSQALGFRNTAASPPSCLPRSGPQC